MLIAPVPMSGLQQATNASGDGRSDDPPRREAQRPTPGRSPGWRRLQFSRMAPPVVTIRTVPSPRAVTPSMPKTLLGVVSRLQLVPSQCSINVLAVPLTVCDPTGQTSLLAMAATPEKEDSDELALSVEVATALQLSR